MIESVLQVYEGSDGDATRALYAELQELGPVGDIAVNLFRACKTSERAKKYRGGNRFGSYRRQSYDTKQWAMNNLCRVLQEHAERLEIVWGWKEDPTQEYHRWVLYAVIPTGQCSFHTEQRGAGPEYPGDWDGIRNSTPDRIIRWCSRLLAAKRAQAEATT